MTNSEKVSQLLNKAGAVHKEVHIFGDQCHISCLSKDAAEKAAKLMINSGWTLRAIVERNVPNKINKGTNLLQTMHTEYLVGLYI